MTFTEPPRPVPPPSPEAIGPGLTLLRPQTRKGVGPGLIVLVDDFAAGVDIRNGVPSPLMKWAEEGYNVIEVTSKAWDGFLNPIDECVASLSAPGICEDPGKLGLLCYSEALERRLRTHALPPSAIVAAVLYGDAIDTASENARIPFLIHSRKELQHKPELSKSYAYPEQASSRFATPYNDDFSYAAEAISHTRNLTFLKRHMEGPYFDLETIWDEHTYYEFEARSVEHTMYTMVAEPYVNHIPTLTGGIGREALTNFYRDHFVFANPEGTSLDLISRTVGVDRVVDEFIFKLNHNKVVDWLLPGVPPTFRDLAIPFIAIVNIRGDRLYHEHITWDQATVLRQAGVLPDTLPFGKDAGEEVRLPVAGAEAVAKMRDKNSVASNQMFQYGVRIVSKEAR